MKKQHSYVNVVKRCDTTICFSDGGRLLECINYCGERLSTIHFSS
jgi:hypothetical protein